jgi:hypothetical protein
MRSTTGLLALLALLGAGCRKDRERSASSLGTQACLPADAFALLGVRLGASDDSVRKLLGPPSRQVEDSNDDEQGRYLERSYDYDSLTVTTGRGTVRRLVAEGPRVATPTGLQLGLTRERVAKLLAPKGVTWPGAPDTLEIYDCSRFGLDMRLGFDAAGTLSALVLDWDTP